LEQGGEDDPGLVLCDRLQLILLLHGGELLVHPPVRVDVAIPGHRLLEGVGHEGGDDRAIVALLEERTRTEVAGALRESPQAALRPLADADRLLTAPGLGALRAT